MSLGGGVLSGKFTRPGAAEAGTRVNAESVSELDHSVARVVGDVATDLGASAAQVAIAWTRARSPSVHPILGARRLDQLVDNLDALQLTLPPDAVHRLDSATGFQIGFPTDFITETSPWVFGPADARTDGHRIAAR